MRQVARGADALLGGHDDTLLVIESMKLETSVKAPRDGRVEIVHVTVGQSFERSAPLAVLAKAEG